MDHKEDNLYLLRKRVEYIEREHKYKEEVNKLQTSIQAAELESWRIKELIEKYKAERDFDWQLEQHGIVRALQAQIVVDTEDLQVAQKHYDAIHAEIMVRYPELSNDFLKANPLDAMKLEAEQNSRLGLIDESDNANKDNSISFGGDSDVVYVWIIGKLSLDNRIASVMFGQFTKAKLPPTDGWVFVGQHLDRNLVAVSKGNKASEGGDGGLAAVAEEDGDAKDKGVLQDAEKDPETPQDPREAKVLSRETMELARDDVIAVKRMTHVMTVKDVVLKGKAKSAKAISDEAKAKAIEDKLTSQLAEIDPSNFIYNVYDCSLDVINGRYLPDGKLYGSPKFKNVRGWTIFRSALYEIPELGIYADGCYDATKGKSVTALLDKRAEIAYEELLSHAMRGDIREGTVHFKRRFSELSRAGSRTVNTDQILSALRTDQLRATARSESNVSLLLMLGSLKNGEEDGEEDGALGSATDTDVLPESKKSQALRLSKQNTAQFGDPNTDFVYRRDDTYRFTTDEFVNASKEMETDTDTDGVLQMIKVTPKGMDMQQTQKQLIIEKEKAREAEAAEAELSRTMKLEEEHRAKKEAVDEKAASSGVDLETKVTFSRNVSYQIGSQGFLIQKEKENYLAQEADASKEVLKRIEERESLVLKLQLAAIKAQKVYMENGAGTGRLVEDEAEDALMNDRTEQLLALKFGNQKRKMNRAETRAHDEVRGVMMELRAMTVNTVEALGAWARICRLEKERVAKHPNHPYRNPKNKSRVETERDNADELAGSGNRTPSKNTVSKAFNSIDSVQGNPDSGPFSKDPRADRAYCVLIAAKGERLYLPSEGVTSEHRKLNRGREEEKLATVIHHVGLFDNKHEAVKAFEVACAQVPLEKRIVDYVDVPRMYIGMRSCRMHYLVRSDGVSPDTPCEECAKSQYRNGSTVIPPVPLVDQPAATMSGALAKASAEIAATRLKCEPFPASGKLTLSLPPTGAGEKNSTGGRTGTTGRTSGSSAGSGTIPKYLERNKPPPAPPEFQPLPQFIWHDSDYLEKMWTDCNFLGDNLFVSRFMSDSIQVVFNPLFLDNEELVETLVAIDTITTTHNVTPGGLVGGNNPLAYLKGRYEQVKEAKILSASITVPPNSYAHIGKPYAVSKLFALPGENPEALGTKHKTVASNVGTLGTYTLPQSLRGSTSTEKSTVTRFSPWSTLSANATPGGMVGSPIKVDSIGTMNTTQNPDVFSATDESVLGLDNALDTVSNQTLPFCEKVMVSNTAGVDAHSRAKGTSVGSKPKEWEGLTVLPARARSTNPRNNVLSNGTDILNSTLQSSPSKSPSNTAPNASRRSAPVLDTSASASVLVTANGSPMRKNVSFSHAPNQSFGPSGAGIDKDASLNTTGGYQNTADLSWGNFDNTEKDFLLEAEMEELKIVTKQRLVRALYLLGQSVRFRNDKFPLDVIETVQRKNDRNKRKILRNGQKKRTGTGVGSKFDEINEVGGDEDSDEEESKLQLKRTRVGSAGDAHRTEGADSHLELSSSGHASTRPGKALMKQIGGGTIAPVRRKGGMHQGSDDASISNTTAGSGESYDYDLLARGQGVEFDIKDAATTVEIRKTNIEQKGNGGVATIVDYGGFGAKLAVKQYRQPVANRIDDVWCRSDVGEWSGLTTKGPRMKSFEFREQLKVEGIRKEKERKMVQMQLRESISCHVVDCSPQIIKAIINKAREIKGSVLGLDIIQAEQFLQLRKTFIKASRKIQRVRRGYVGRMRVKAIRKAIKAKLKHRKVTEELASVLASKLVPETVQKCVKKVVKKCTKPLAHFTAHMSGIYLIVSVFDIPRKLLKNDTSKCMSCQTKSMISRYMPYTHTTTVERSICTCAYLRNCECWLIRAFDPITCSSFYTNVSTYDLRTLMLETVKLALIPLEQHRNSFVVPQRTAAAGGSNRKFLDDVAPLFATPEEALAELKRMDRSPYASRLKAAKESSILPLVPHNFSDNLCRIIAGPGTHGTGKDGVGAVPSINGTDEHITIPPATSYPQHAPGVVEPWVQKSLPISTELSMNVKLPYHAALANATVYNMNFRFNDRPTPVYDLDTPSELKTLFPTWLWEPFTEVHQLERQVEFLEHYADNVLQTRIDNALAILNTYKRSFQEYNEHEVEMFNMLHEDKRARYILTLDEYEEAHRNIIRAMQYSKSELMAIEGQERQEEENWKQSWDGVEDGNAWIGLNNKRKLELLLQRHYGEWQKALRNVQVLNRQCRRYKKSIRKATEHLERVTSDLSSFTPLLLQQKELLRTMLDVAKESVKCILALYSMPQKNKLDKKLSNGRDTRRRLQRIDPTLVYIRDPLQRAHRVYRSGWSLVDRRFQSLRKQSGSENKNILKILFADEMSAPADREDGEEGHSESQNIVKNSILKNVDKSKLTSSSSVTATISASSKVDATVAAAIRSVVEIYNDPVTDYLIISIGQQTTTVEESSLHDDFQLNRLDFSDLTSDVEFNEILLKPFDVDFMLKRSPLWPAEMMKPKVSESAKDMVGANAEVVDAPPLALELSMTPEDTSPDSHPGTGKGSKHKPNKSNLVRSHSVRGLSRSTSGTGGRLNSNPASRPGSSAVSNKASKPGTADRKSTVGSHLMKTASMRNQENVQESSKSLQISPSATASAPMGSMASSSAVDTDSKSQEHSTVSDDGMQKKTGGSLELNLDTIHSVHGSSSVGSHFEVPSSAVNRLPAHNRVLQKLKKYRLGVMPKRTGTGHQQEEVQAPNMNSSHHSVTIGAPGHDEVAAPHAKELEHVFDNTKVIAWTNKKTRYADLPCTYQKRRQVLETKKYEKQIKLFNYLKLHPYSGRPCLGLLHFFRRTQYAVRQISTSKWFKDILKQRPLIWNVNEISFVGGELGGRLSTMDGQDIERRWVVEQQSFPAETVREPGLELTKPRHYYVDTVKNEDKIRKTKLFRVAGRLVEVKLRHSMGYIEVKIDSSQGEEFCEFNEKYAEMVSGELTTQAVEKESVAGVNKPAATACSINTSKSSHGWNDASVINYFNNKAKESPCYLHSGRKTLLSCTIPIHSILQSMLMNHISPLLISAFLYEVVSNSFSNVSIEYILERLDMLLPGYGAIQQWWRKPFQGYNAHIDGTSKSTASGCVCGVGKELPILTFITQEVHRYRGPVYSLHRFLSGKYIYCQFYVASNGDIRIELKRPVDGKFSHHTYEGSMVIINLTSNEVRAFVVNIARQLYIAHLEEQHVKAKLRLYKEQQRRKRERAERARRRKRRKSAMGQTGRNSLLLHASSKEGAPQAHTAALAAVPNADPSTTPSYDNSKSALLAPELEDRGCLLYMMICHMLHLLHPHNADKLYQLLLHSITIKPSPLSVALVTASGSNSNIEEGDIEGFLHLQGVRDKDKDAVGNYVDSPTKQQSQSRGQGMGLNTENGPGSSTSMATPIKEPSIASNAPPVSLKTLLKSQPSMKRMPSGLGLGSKSDAKSSLVSQRQNSLDEVSESSLGNKSDKLKKKVRRSKSRSKGGESPDAEQRRGNSLKRGRTESENSENTSRTFRDKNTRDKGKAGMEALVVDVDSAEPPRVARTGPGSPTYLPLGALKTSTVSTTTTNQNPGADFHQLSTAVAGSASASDSDSISESSYGDTTASDSSSDSEATDSDVEEFLIENGKFSTPDEDEERLYRRHLEKSKTLELKKHVKLTVEQYIAWLHRSSADLMITDISTDKSVKQKQQHMLELTRKQEALLSHNIHFHGSHDSQKAQTHDVRGHSNSNSLINDIDAFLLDHNIIGKVSMLADDSVNIDEISPGEVSGLADGGMPGLKQNDIHLYTRNAKTFSLNEKQPHQLLEAYTGRIPGDVSTSTSVDNDPFSKPDHGSLNPSISGSIHSEKQAAAHRKMLIADLVNQVDVVEYEWSMNPVVQVTTHHIPTNVLLDICTSVSLSGTRVTENAVTLQPSGSPTDGTPGSNPITARTELDSYRSDFGFDTGRSRVESGENTTMARCDSKDTNNAGGGADPVDITGNIELLKASININSNPQNITTSNLVEVFGGVWGCYDLNKTCVEEGEVEVRDVNGDVMGRKALSARDSTEVEVMEEGGQGGDGDGFVQEVHDDYVTGLSGRNPSAGPNKPPASSSPGKTSESRGNGNKQSTDYLNSDKALVIANCLPVNTMMIAKTKYYFVRMLTSESRSQYVLDIRPSTVDNATVESFLRAKEVSQMALEDEASGKANTLQYCIETERVLAQYIEHVKKDFKSTAKELYALQCRYKGVAETMNKERLKQDALYRQIRKEAALESYSMFVRRILLSGSKRGTTAVLTNIHPDVSGSASLTGDARGEANTVGKYSLSLPIKIPTPPPSPAATPPDMPWFRRPPYVPWPVLPEVRELMEVMIVQVEDFLVDWVPAPMERRASDASASDHGSEPSRAGAGDVIDGKEGEVEGLKSGQNEAQSDGEPLPVAVDSPEIISNAEAADASASEVALKSAGPTPRDQVHRNSGRQTTSSTPLHTGRESIHSHASSANQSAHSSTESELVSSELYEYVDHSQSFVGSTDWNALKVEYCRIINMRLGLSTGVRNDSGDENLSAANTPRKNLSAADTPRNKGFQEMRTLRTTTTTTVTTKTEIVLETMAVEADGDSVCSNGMAPNNVHLQQALAEAHSETMSTRSIQPNHILNKDDITNNQQSVVYTDNVVCYSIQFIKHSRHQRLKVAGRQPAPMRPSRVVASRVETASNSTQLSRDLGKSSGKGPSVVSNNQANRRQTSAYDVAASGNGSVGAHSFMNSIVELPAPFNTNRRIPTSNLARLRYLPACPDNTSGGHTTLMTHVYASNHHHAYRNPKSVGRYLSYNASLGHMALKRHLNQQINPDGAATASYSRYHQPQMIQLILHTSDYIRYDRPILPRKTSSTHNSPEKPTQNAMTNLVGNVKDAMGNMSNKLFKGASNWFNGGGNDVSDSIADELSVDPGTISSIRGDHLTTHCVHETVEYDDDVGYESVKDLPLPSYPATPSLCYVLPPNHEQSKLCVNASKNRKHPYLQVKSKCSPTERDDVSNLDDAMEEQIVSAFIGPFDIYSVIIHDPVHSCSWKLVCSPRTKSKVSNAQIFRPKVQQVEVAEEREQEVESAKDCFDAGSAADCISAGVISVPVTGSNSTCELLSDFNIESNPIVHDAANVSQPDTLSDSVSLSAYPSSSMVSVDVTATDETLEAHIAEQLVQQVLNYSVAGVLASRLQKAMFLDPIEKCQNENDELSDLIEIAEDSLQKVKRFRAFCCEKKKKDVAKQNINSVVNIQVLFNQLYGTIFDSIPDLYKRVVTVGNSLLSGNTSTILDLQPEVEVVPEKQAEVIPRTVSEKGTSAVAVKAHTFTKASRKAKFELRKKPAAVHAPVVVDSLEAQRQKQEATQLAISKFYQDFYSNTTTAKAMMTSISEGSVSVVSDAVAKTYAYLDDIRNVVQKYKNRVIEGSIKTRSRFHYYVRGADSVDNISAVGTGAMHNNVMTTNRSHNRYHSSSVYESPFNAVMGSVFNTGATGPSATSFSQWSTASVTSTSTFRSVATTPGGPIPTTPSRRAPAPIIYSAYIPADQLQRVIPIMCYATDWNDLCREIYTLQYAGQPTDANIGNSGGYGRVQSTSTFLFCTRDNIQYSVQATEKVKSGGAVSSSGANGTGDVNAKASNGHGSLLSAAPPLGSQYNTPAARYKMMESQVIVINKRTASGTGESEGHVTKSELSSKLPAAPLPRNIRLERWLVDYEHHVGWRREEAEDVDAQESLYNSSNSHTVNNGARHDAKTKPSKQHAPASNAHGVSKSQVPVSARGGMSARGGLSARSGASARSASARSDDGADSSTDLDQDSAALQLKTNQRMHLLEIWHSDKITIDQAIEQERLALKGLLSFNGTKKDHQVLPRYIDSDSKIILNGDSLVMFRFGYIDFITFCMWAEDRFQEYQPIRAKRLLKEGKEREFRINNHRQWVRRVYHVADLFQNAFNMYYNGELNTGEMRRGSETRTDIEGAVEDTHTTNADSTVSHVHLVKKAACEATLFELRILLTKYMKQLKDFGGCGIKTIGDTFNFSSLPSGKSNKSQVHEMRKAIYRYQKLNEHIYQDAFMIDTRLSLSSDEKLLKYDTPPVDSCTHLDEVFGLLYTPKHAILFDMLKQSEKADDAEVGAVSGLGSEFANFASEVRFDLEASTALETSIDASHSHTYNRKSFITVKDITHEEKQALYDKYRVLYYNIPHPIAPEPSRPGAGGTTVHHHHIHHKESHIDADGMRVIGEQEDAESGGNQRANSFYIPTVGQIMYAIYITHCSQCTLGYGMCRVPGCGSIRCHVSDTHGLNGDAFGDKAVPLGVDNENEDGHGPTYDAVTDATALGTGISPLELEIKAFLLNFDGKCNQMLKTELAVPISAIQESIASIDLDREDGAAHTKAGVYPHKSKEKQSQLGLIKRAQMPPSTINKEYVFGASASDVVTQEQEAMQRYRTLYNKHISMIMRYKNIKLQAKMYRYMQRRLLRYQIRNVVNVTSKPHKKHKGLLPDNSLILQCKGDAGGIQHDEGEIIYILYKNHFERLESMEKHLEQDRANNKKAGGGSKGLKAKQSEHHHHHHHHHLHYGHKHGLMALNEDDARLRKMEEQAIVSILTKTQIAPGGLPSLSLLGTAASTAINHTYPSDLDTSRSIPHPGDMTDTGVNNLGDPEQGKNGNHNDSNDDTGSLLQIPAAFIQDMLGCMGVNGVGQYILDAKSISPYPDRSISSNAVSGTYSELSHHSSDRHNTPMHPKLFEWIVSKLSVSMSRNITDYQDMPNRKHAEIVKRPATASRPSTRTNRTGPESSGLPLVTKSFVTFDRCHCEKTLTLQDGSVVIVQILQGIIAKDEVLLQITNTNSGCPIGADRYYPIEYIDSTLRPGFTISVYDIRSRVTRCTVIEGRPLTRLAVAINFPCDHFAPEENYPLLAKMLLGGMADTTADCHEMCPAQQALRLNRVGNLCTSVTLDLNRLVSRSNGSKIDNHSKRMDGVNSSTINMSTKKRDVHASAAPSMHSSTINNSLSASKNTHNSQPSVRSNKHDVSVLGCKAFPLNSNRNMQQKQQCIQMQKMKQYKQQKQNQQFYKKVSSSVHHQQHMVEYLKQSNLFDYT